MTVGRRRFAGAIRLAGEIRKGPPNRVPAPQSTGLTGENLSHEGTNSKERVSKVVADAALARS